MLPPSQIKATSVDFQSIVYSIIGASPWPITSSLFAIDMSTAILNLTGMVTRVGEEMCGCGDQEEIGEMVWGPGRGRDVRVYTRRRRPGRED